MADLLQKRPTVEEIDSGFWLVQRWEQVSGYPIFQTSWYYSWESYHSAVNDFSGFQYPAPIICDRLGLLGGKRGVDLMDRRGRQAAIYRCSKEQWSKSHGTLYLRKDLLDEFLVAENKSLVWVVWGERGFTTDHAPSLNRRADIMAALQSHEHIFRRVQVYDPLSP